MKLSDEALQAPMGMFFPSVFCLPDDHTPLMWGQEPLGPDCEDVYDEGHWVAEGGMVGSQVRGGVAGGVGKTDVQGASGNGGMAGGCGQLGELPEATKRLRSVPAGKLLGLDQAVHLSIDCASESRGLGSSSRGLGPSSRVLGSSSRGGGGGGGGSSQGGCANGGP